MGRVSNARLGDLTELSGNGYPRRYVAADSGTLIATEPINAGSGIALADGESYDVTMTLASEP